MKLCIYLVLAILSLPQLLQSQPEGFTCGEKRQVVRSYGTVELRIDCKRFKGQMRVSEYKGDTLHGISQGFRLPSGTKKDSCFYRNNEEYGTCLGWDTLGNVVNRTNYRDGKEIGKMERYYAGGRPRIIKHFNDEGKEEGPWEEWWSNGNKKAEFIAENGRIVSGTEYYPNGKPRIRYSRVIDPRVKSIFKQKLVASEAWNPDGRPAGKIVNGQGEWLLFPDGRDSTDKTIFREVYKDSLMIKGEVLDSAELKQWFK